MGALKETWSIPLAHGSKVLAVTVPRATIDKTNPRLVNRRNELNERIKGYEADDLYVSITATPTYAWKKLTTMVCTVTYSTYTMPCPMTQIMLDFGTMRYTSHRPDTTSLAATSVWR